MEPMRKAEDFEYLGPALATLRRRRKIPLRFVAKKLDISVHVLSRCETSQRDLTTRNLLQYLEIVRATLTDLDVAMDAFKYKR
jgi:hypothetical protein